MTPRAVLAVKVCPYGCRYFNDGWHMENCPGPQAVFFIEPEYPREQAADEVERRREAVEDERLYYPEAGLHE